MEEKARFNVIYMDEAIKFLESLDMKARNKIAYNIGKAIIFSFFLWNLYFCINATAVTVTDTTLINIQLSKV